MLIENCIVPGNESMVHYELKQIAKYILKSKKCSIIGEEVDIGHSTYLHSDNTFNQKNVITKMNIDAIGLYMKGGFYQGLDYKTKKYEFQEPEIRAIGIEAKATLGDFKNGFCCLADKTYIIAPKGVIPHELIPDKIGLIEVDLDNYHIISDNGIFRFRRIEEAIKPKLRLDQRFENGGKKIGTNKYYQHWCKEIMRRISYRNTNDILYRHNSIEIVNKK